MGHITERADRFAKKYETPKEEVVSQAEKEAAFSRTFASPAGLREQWKRAKEILDAGK